MRKFFSIFFKTATVLTLSVVTFLIMVLFIQFLGLAFGPLGFVAGFIITIAFYVAAVITILDRFKM
jgi:hypothetical protein